MASNFGDALTVVGDTSYLKRVDEENSDHSLKYHHNPRYTTNSKSRSNRNDFITLDYTIEERPFFIPIGHDGVIGALDKLDKQLLQVFKQYLKKTGLVCSLCLCTMQAGRTRLLSKKVPTDWTGKEVIPGQMGLINHG